MPSPNRAIIAAAGARKTQTVIDDALAATEQRVLIVTYTNENRQQIANRIARSAGHVPGHITIMGWFQFLMNQCARPYQRAVLNEPDLIAGLNFLGERSQYVRKDQPLQYFVDDSGSLYRDFVADFVCTADEATSGALIRRLEGLFDRILIDEFQDLVGYDLDVVERLLESQRIEVLLVGDPRQHTLSTNNSARNRRYRGAGLLDWLAERPNLCTIELLSTSYRCNQAICDFADSLFPEFDSTRSGMSEVTDHDGIFEVTHLDLHEYVERHNPKVLRYRKDVDTFGLAATNIGVAKGSTFPRVLIFPTRPMLRFLRDGDASALKTRESLYVAVTRAKHSVAFVVPAGG